MKNYESRLKCIEKKIPYVMSPDEIEKIELPYAKENPDSDITVIPISQNEVLVYIIGRINKPFNTGGSE